MAEIIRLRKGLDINLLGTPAETVTELKVGGMVALCPDNFTGVTPKVVVKEQQTVKLCPIWTPVCSGIPPGCSPQA